MNLPVLVGSWSGYWSGVRLAGSGLVLSPVSGWLVFGLVSDWLVQVWFSVQCRVGSGVRLAGSGLVLSPVSGWLVFDLVSAWLILGLVLGLVSGWLVLGLVTRPDLSDWYCLVTRVLGAGPRTKLHTYLLLKLESVKYGNLS
jgi:hypothetical protein